MSCDRSDSRPEGTVPMRHAARVAPRIAAGLGWAGLRGAQCTDDLARLLAGHGVPWPPWWVMQRARARGLSTRCDDNEAAGRRRPQGGSQTWRDACEPQRSMTHLGGSAALCRGRGRGRCWRKAMFAAGRAGASCRRGSRSATMDADKRSRRTLSRSSGPVRVVVEPARPGASGRRPRSRRPS